MEAVWVEVFEPDQVIHTQFCSLVTTMSFFSFEEKLETHREAEKGYTF